LLLVLDITLSIAASFLDAAISPPQPVSNITATIATVNSFHTLFFILLLHSGQPSAGNAIPVPRCPEKLYRYHTLFCTHPVAEFPPTLQQKACELHRDTVLSFYRFQLIDDGNIFIVPSFFKKTAEPIPIPLPVTYYFSSSTSILRISFVAISFTISAMKSPRTFCPSSPLKRLLTDTLPSSSSF